MNFFSSNNFCLKRNYSFYLYNSNFKYIYRLDRMIFLSINRIFYKELYIGYMYSQNTQYCSYFSITRKNINCKTRKHQMYSMNQKHICSLSFPAFILAKIEKRPLRIDPIENFLPWTAHIIVLYSQRRETERFNIL